MARKTTTPKEPTKPVIDPFKKIASSKDKKGGDKLDHVNSADEITKQAVDEYKRLAAEIKRLTGEQSGHKAVVESFARSTFCDRQVKGVSGNFYVDGNNDVVCYQAHNANSGLTAEDYASFVEQHGEEAAEELLCLDKGSVKFNTKTLEQEGVMEKVVAALQSLPAEILENLFTPATYKVSDDVFVKMRKHAKRKADYEALMASLQIKNFIKG